MAEKTMEKTKNKKKNTEQMKYIYIYTRSMYASVQFH